MKNLDVIFFKLFIILGLGGTFWNGIEAVFIRQPFDPLAKPWGVVLGYGTLCIWGILRCITPTKWWETSI